MVLMTHLAFMTGNEKYSLDGAKKNNLGISFDEIIHIQGWRIIRGRESKATEL